MSVAAAKSAYESLSNDVFGKRRHLKYYQFSHRKLEDVIKRVVERNRLASDESSDGMTLMTDPTPDVDRKRPYCRSAVVSLQRKQGSRDQIHLFRSYVHLASTRDSRSVGDSARICNPNDQERVFIWEAARATSAAPHYFKEINIQGYQYMDGGLVENNPSCEAWREASAMHRNRCSPECQINAEHRNSQAKRHHHCNAADSESGISNFISIGTGKGASRTFFSNKNFMHKIVKLIKRSLNGMTDPEPNHDRMMDLTTHTEVYYARLNVDSGLENMKMDECQLHMGRNGVQNMTIVDLRRITEIYLEQKATKRALREAAERLVCVRRGRTADGHGGRFRGLTVPGSLGELWRIQQTREDDMTQSGTEPGRSAHSDRPYLNINTDVNGTGTWLKSNGSATTPAGARQDINQTQLRTDQSRSGSQHTRQHELSEAMSPRADGPLSDAYESHSQPLHELRSTRDPQEAEGSGVPAQQSEPPCSNNQRQ
ncbi:hypothetical protein KC340_g7533 [Hortaea werneckii]|nr:hypothetical protein KC342_g14745 [Hortaea werneckii]KAI7103476.1 hypothetical protein KC339_g5247 [Hortaea werneckii]KAI7244329.1 hypothetical protein KC365_g1535 [Hortaea werneckii]KAI7320721.1 hypothetical protein KC340_g7533 [Hortaea werneckii]KAI7388486.1 hypothetical protein KC328_g8915 [Hortaea werneckii]